MEGAAVSLYCDVLYTDSMSETVDTIVSRLSVGIKVDALVVFIYPLIWIHLTSRTIDIANRISTI